MKNNIKQVGFFILVFLSLLIFFALYLGIVFGGAILIGYFFVHNIILYWILGTLWLFFWVGGFIYWQVKNDERMRIEREKECIHGK